MPPTRDLDIDVTATVVSAGLESSLAPDVGCVPRSASVTQWLRVSLIDANDQPWHLWLPPDLAGHDAIAVGQTLAIGFRVRPVNIFLTHVSLTVRRGDRVELFFAQGRLDIANAGFTATPGDLLCPRSPPDASGCTTWRNATVVSNGSAQKTDPCGDLIGDFEVSTYSQGRGEAPPSCGGLRGFCDSFSDFRVSGVRRH